MILHPPHLCKLGKRAPKRDHRDLKLARYLTPQLPPIPPSVDWGAKIGAWGLLANDRFGDCTAAAAGHAVMLFTANTGALFTPRDADILALYTAATRDEGAAFDPVTGANDNGAYITDVLNEWRKSGLAGHKLGAFASIDPANQDHLKAAIAFLGAVEIGLQLPISAQTQAVWEVTDPNLKGDASPGSWGGHAVLLIAYNSATARYTAVSWGMRVEISAAFLTAYMDEAAALLTSDWLSGGKSPSGFDLQALQGDLAAISGPH